MKGTTMKTNGIGSIARRFSAILVLPVLALVAVGCADDDPVAPVSKSFTVTIENVSVSQTVPTTRADGIVPISPGAYAVFTGNNPIFTLGGTADAGLEGIAEDGETGATTTKLAADPNVSSGGAFMGPNGPVLPSEPAPITFTATEGDKLQIATMFVQSNDWFYAFGNGGLDLFNGSTPVTGDVTSSLVLYDAGTEEDTAPGTGPDQKPAQAPGVINVGPADDDTTIRVASGFTIPPTASVIRVTITAE